MQTNGCTMTYGKGGLGTCRAHASMIREICAPHERRAPLVHVNKYHGAMRKHANWQHEPKDAALAMLDGLSRVRVAPMGTHGLVIRKAVK